jgi:phosphatidylethanolamine/phosphatidyl-N-methylethanolamine N-methyltransferase
MGCMSSRPVANRLRFFGEWLRNPVQTAAIAPSSMELATAVLAELPQGTRRVIELGGGTGAITQALLRYGIAQRDLLVIEVNPVLHAQLHARYPGARVVRGDALHTAEHALAEGFLADGPADAVVSGLGLLGMARDAQSAILQSAFACLRPEGVLVQFTYGPLSPVRDDVALELGLSARRGGLVLRNVPPATVWTFRRSRAKAIKPRTVYR